MYGIIALIALIIIGAVVVMQSRTTGEQAAETDTAINQEQEATTSEPVTEQPVADGQFSDESDVMGEVVVHEISFNGTAYSPAQITIKNGDIVVFKNNSDKDFWPASAMHPDHLIYPEFDADKGIAPGGTYEFKFTKTGAWGFHDHLTPSAFGRITVE